MFLMSQHFTVRSSLLETILLVAANTADVTDLHDTSNMCTIQQHQLIQLIHLDSFMLWKL